MENNLFIYTVIFQEFICCLSGKITELTLQISECESDEE